MTGRRGRWPVRATCWADGGGPSLCQTPPAAWRSASVCRAGLCLQWGRQPAGVLCMHFFMP